MFPAVFRLMVIWADIVFARGLPQEIWITNSTIFYPKFFLVLPSILNKYQFHFDQLWANISSILTNFDQRLNYWGVLPPPGPPPYSDIPG
jgi:hypothetical protein